MIWKISSVE